MDRKSSHFLTNPAFEMIHIKTFKMIDDTRLRLKRRLESDSFLRELVKQTGL